MTTTETQAPQAEEGQKVTVEQVKQALQTLVDYRNQHKDSKSIDPLLGDGFFLTFDKNDGSNCFTSLAYCPENFLASGIVHQMQINPRIISPVIAHFLSSPG